MIRHVRQIDFQLTLFFYFQGSIPKVTLVYFFLYPKVPGVFWGSNNSIKFFRLIELAKGFISNPNTAITFFSITFENLKKITKNFTSRF